MQYFIPLQHNAEIQDTFPRYWLGDLIQDFFVVDGSAATARLYEVLRYRFGLDGQTRFTLDEIGIIYDFTRERARQLEERALRGLRDIFLTGSHERKHTRITIHADFFQQITQYRNTLESLNEVEKEDRLLEHTKEFFNVINVDRDTLGLVLEVLGYKRLNVATVGESFAWGLRDFDFARVEGAIQECFRYLRDVAIAKPFQDILLSINRKRSAKTRFSASELNLALDLSDDIEVIQDDLYQVKYERLRSLPDKIYRLLHENGEPIHAQQLAIMVNREAFKVGEKSRINAHNVGARLSSDNRFMSIGRSGEWALSEWTDVATDKILTLMEDALHAAGEPLSSKAIFEYVRSLRTVKETAVYSYLSYEPQFVRVGRDLFALASWGMTSISKSISKPKKRVMGKAKLAEYIQLVFEDKEVDEMFASELAKEISNIVPELNVNGIYNQIIVSPAVEIIAREVGKRNRRYAKYNPQFRNKLTRTEVLTKDIPMGQLIENTVRELLRNEQDHTMVLGTVRDTVSAKLYCPPASVYSAISKMSDIQKYKDPITNSMYCRLIEPSHEFTDKIDKITDPSLKTEIQRALRMLHVDTVDLALFQLGKIFEDTLKRYMLHVQIQGTYPVKQTDLQKLYNMIQWAGNTGLIKEKKALEYLRIERNDRAHGGIPDIDERIALLNTASTQVNYYLTYIALIQSRIDGISNGK